MKKKIFAIIMPVFLSIGITQNVQADLDEGLVAYWSFDDCSANDKSGNSNDGKKNGTQCVDGQIGKAIDFNGTSDYIEFPTSNSLDTRNSHSMFAWIYARGDSGPIFNYCVNCWGVHFWQTSNQTQSKELFSRFVKRNGNFSIPLQATVLEKNTWHFVGTTYDSNTGVAKIYDNGLIVKQVNLGVIELATQYPLRMAKLDNDSRVFNGLIDEARIYNRALTDDDVLALYKNQVFSAVNPVLDTDVCNDFSPLLSDSACNLEPNPTYDSIKNIAAKLTANNFSDVTSDMILLMSYLSMNPYFKNTPFVTFDKDASQIETVLKKRLNLGLKNIDAGIVNWAVNLIVDILNANYGRNVAVTSWFLMKQAQVVGNVKYDNQNAFAALPIELFHLQANLLISAIQKELKEYGVVKKAADLVTLEINAEILKGQATLTKEYGKYFMTGSDCVSVTTCKKAILEKNKIMRTIISKQYDFLTPYLTGKKDTLQNPKKKIAIQLYNAWKLNLAGQLVKQEFATRAELSGLIASGNYAEAKKRAELFFGVNNIDVSTGRIKFTR